MKIILGKNFKTKSKKSNVNHSVMLRDSDTNNNENSTNIDLNQNKVSVLKGYKKYLKYAYNIRFKLVMAFLVPVVFIIILGVISYTKSSNGLVESYEKTTLTNMSNMVKYINFGFESVASKAKLLNSNNILKYYYSSYYKKDDIEEMARFREVQEYVNSNVLLEDYVENIYLFSNYGTGISSNGSLESTLYDEFNSEGEGAGLSETKEENVWLGSHPYIDEKMTLTNDRYAVSYVQDLYNLTNKPNGYIIIDVSMDFVIDTLTGSGLPEGSVIAFITRDGREIVNGVVSEGFKFIDQNYYKNSINENENEGYDYVKYNDDDYLYVYSKEKFSGSMLCAVIPKSYIIEQADDVKNVTYIIVILACIVAIVFGCFMASGISNVIHKTITVVQKTALGDLTNTISVKRKDEFSILSKSINDMITSMLGLIRRVTRVSKTLSNSASVVSDSSSILMDATNSISVAVEYIEQGVTQQAEEAENCLLQMADLADKINDVYYNTNNISEIATKTKEIVGNGIVIIDELGNKAKDTSNITRTVINNIENLENESRAISKIIGTINEIVEQTNLLSLNAAIEAARAGQAGRGFAIVADEIGKLSQQSMKASKEIERIINKIENQTKITALTARDAENIVLSQEDALNNTVKVFTNINQHVENLTDNLKKIAKGVEGIEHAKDGTLSSIESISAASQETAAATNQLGVTAVDQLNEVKKLNDVVIQLSDDSMNLEASICIFRIN